MDAGDRLLVHGGDWQCKSEHCAVARGAVHADGAFVE